MSSGVEAARSELRERTARTTALAREQLGLQAVAAAPTSDLDRVRTALAAIDERLAADGTTRSALAHGTMLEALKHRFDGRSEALSRAHAAIVELRKITSPTAMLARAPAALCQGSALKRAIVSSIAGSTMVPEAVFFADDPAAARRVLEQLRSEPVRLEHPLIETDVLRRRRATLVVDASVNPRVHRRMAELIGWSSFVAAPLLGGPNVIGVVHADRGPGEPLDVLDRDVLWEFASGLSHAYESASLRRTLQQERDQLRQFLEWLNVRSAVLTDSPVAFAPSQPAPRISSEQQPPAIEGRDDRLVFSGLLTKRELDVLRLLVDGGTNRTIAGALVLSETTVKFHVNSILRKLHVANRAEAAARYLALLGVTPPQV
jgi:DNA-binding CsgD family transcriptional regulator